MTGVEEWGAVHIVGVGGAHMSAIARLLRARGLPVSGSDAHDSDLVAAVRATGARVSIGHSADHVADADTVIVSSAVRPDNPELVEARRRGLRILPRADALAAIMADRREIAVSGTHGKTTTTAMVVAALQRCGLDPSYAVGADLDVPGSGAHAGTSEWFVVEADESDGAFLRYSPYAAVVTNVGLDHPDRYADLEAVHAAFVEFSARVRADGFFVCCADDAGSARLAEVARAGGVDVLTYGEADGADLRLTDVVLPAEGARASLSWQGRSLGSLDLRVPGRHNLLNAAAVVTVGLRLDLPYAGLAAGLAAFRGARRRMELRGTARGVRVYDDYAHNPPKVRAALEAGRQLAGVGRLIVAFQPHLYSRTAAFAGEFGVALAAADEVVVLDVYAAREDPMPGVSGRLIADAVTLPSASVHYVPDRSSVAPLLASVARPGDLVMTIGAGDVTQLAPDVLLALSAGRS